MNSADLIELRMIQEARASFWAYRQYINGGQKGIKFKRGWFQRECSLALQIFYEDLKAGLKPKLVIEAPPQHGKSILIIDFISWAAGHNPNLKTIYTSFSDRLGVRANLRLQRIYALEKYKKCFPETRITETKSNKIQEQKLRNKDIIEYQDAEGYFRNTTVRGTITGESLDLGVIDDPIKSREEAGSKTIRDKTWDWFTDDFFSRFSEDAGMLAILTRWHIDDPIGRLIKEMPEIKVLKYPAIAKKDEEHRKAGEALFPEHKSIEFLLERKKLMYSGNWEALYQQSPQIEGGEIINGAWFGRYDRMPKIKYRKQFGDTAQKTEEKHDYSVFGCFGLGEDNKLYIIDLVRGKWTAPDLKTKAKDFWAKHKALPTENLGSLRELGIEDKASGTGLIQEIKAEAKIPIKAIPRVKDKLTRALDVVSYIKSGYVLLPADAPWVSDFVAECEGFTADDSHDFDDQFDVLIDAIDDMIAINTSQYNIRRL